MNKLYRIIRNISHTCTFIFVPSSWSPCGESVRARSAGPGSESRFEVAFRACAAGLNAELGERPWVTEAYIWEFKSIVNT